MLKSNGLLVKSAGCCLAQATCPVRPEYHRTHGRFLILLVAKSSLAACNDCAWTLMLVVAVVGEAIEGFEGEAEAVGLDADCAAEGLVHLGDG
jgi:hypothetical protein